MTEPIQVRNFITQTSHTPSSVVSQVLSSVLFSLVVIVATGCTNSEPLDLGFESSMDAGVDAGDEPAQYADAGVVVDDSPQEDASVQTDAMTQVDAQVPDAQTPDYAKDGWCQNGNWAVCIDFDGYGDAASGGRRAMTQSDQKALEVQHWGYDVGNIYRQNGRIYELDCSSTRALGGDCQPYVENGQVRMNPESTSFGLGMLRVQRPIEFVSAGGQAEERHIHFDSSLVVHGRQFAALHISEMPAAGLPDLRLLGTISSSADPFPSYSLVIKGGTQFSFSGIHWNPPAKNCVPGADPSQCWSQENYYRGVPDFQVDPTEPALLDKMHEVDVYLSRTHIRVLVKGKEYVNRAIADLGFDRGYVSVATVAYNPLKSAGGREDWVGELTSSLFDNIAFDGRTLERNALNPSGQSYFVFHTRGATSCTVASKYKGEVAPFHDGVWNPVYTLVPDSIASLDASDIDCNHAASGEGDYRALHFVR